MERDLITGFDNRGGQVGLRTEGENLTSLPLHPVSDSSSRWQNELSDFDKISAVEDFAYTLVGALTKDYGDWMREANVAWLKLSQRLQGDFRAQSALEDLHLIIQFAPSWLPFETCRRAIDTALDLRDRLGAETELELHDFGMSSTEPDQPEAN